MAVRNEHRVNKQNVCGVHSLCCPYIMHLSASIAESFQQLQQSGDAGVNLLHIHEEQSHRNTWDVPQDHGHRAVWQTGSESGVTRVSK